MKGLKNKQAMWYKMGNQLTNKGRNPREGFKSKDAVGPVKHSFANQTAESIVDRLLAR